MTEPVQIRAHCWFPTKVEVPWRDANGTTRLWKWDARPGQPADIRDDIDRQMEAWSRELFELSERRYALFYKSDWAAASHPLSGAKKRGGKYWIKPRHIETVVAPDCLANVVLFFSPKGGVDVPPLRARAYKTNTRLNKTVRCLVFPTDLQQPSPKADAARRMDAFRDEFWHLLQSAHCEASGRRPLSPHSDEANGFSDRWRYLYSEAASPSMCRDLSVLWGWERNWGRAPSEIRRDAGDTGDTGT